MQFLPSSQETCPFTVILHAGQWQGVPFLADSSEATRASSRSAVSAPVWRKSTYSGGASGNCLETAAVPGAVLVRDSQNPDGPRLAFAPRAWVAFAAKVKRKG